jgi:hypothetical protein
VKGIPTKRPETTTSCSLDPTMKGRSTKSSGTIEDCDQGSIYVFVRNFVCEKVWSESQDHIYDYFVRMSPEKYPTKGQGAQSSMKTSDS